MEFKNYLKRLPVDEKTFTLNLKGEATKQDFDGTFTFKIMDIKGQMEVPRIKALLSGGLKVDEDTAFLYHCIATNKVSIKTSPEWWVESDYGMRLLDSNVLLELYTKYIEFENEFYTELKNGSK